MDGTWRARWARRRPPRGRRDDGRRDDDADADADADADGPEQHSYALDYAVLAAFLAAYLLLASLAEPFHRLFFVNNLAILFPFAELERVPLWLLLVYALVAPLAALLLYNAVARAPAHTHRATLLGFAAAVVLTSLVTEAVKNAVGRPRPDLVARCKPRPGTARDVLVAVDVCTERDGRVLHDGWRSFPSGHASLAFAGLGFLACFLAGQLRVYRENDGRRGLARALACLAPLAAAAAVAISRCQDYRHDVYDVCAGAALGAAFAYWSYRHYFPALASSRCAEPYPPPGGDAKDRGRRWGGAGRDEEEGPILGRGADDEYELARLHSPRRR